MLVIEDDTAQLELLAQRLGGQELRPGHPAELRAARSMAQALSDPALLADEVGLILLDLGLPDADGLDSLVRLVDQFPTVPVTVLTGSPEPEIHLRALSAGAQEVLFKGSTMMAGLVDALRRVLARHTNLMVTAKAMAAAEMQAMSLRRAENIDVVLPVSSRLSGAATLAESFPEVFEQSVGRYARIVEGRRAERVVEIDYRTSSRLRVLIGELGLLRAGPRDIADIHVAALARLTEDRSREQASAIVEAGLLTLSQALGQLAFHYRTRAIGARLVVSASEKDDGTR